MRFRKTNIVAVMAAAATGLLMMYLVSEAWNLQSYEAVLTREELAELESKLRKLESDFMVNQKTIGKIRETVEDLRKLQGAMKSGSKSRKTKGKVNVVKNVASVARADGVFASVAPSQCDIQMDKVYDELLFDNPDGGAWKQGWVVEYDKEKVLEPGNKLKVFVMPHSHNDPGWKMTFEEYYKSQTRHILDSVMAKLGEDKRRKFVWAEISFFALWWGQQTVDTQNKVKQFLKDGQLEIVTGGWVMNDEANSYFFAIMEQMILGHEWCMKNLDGYKPNNGWAIDPFGMSPTMAYALKRMGLDNMLIQRTHYSVKKLLAQSQDLEFLWRQHWDHGSTTDILTHMMPFYSYDVPHTCGPDPKVCCQFDFTRLPGGKHTCPWNVPPKAITDANVAERATLLLDQYRKKASLYKTRTVLAPLGDDFRYTSKDECDKQFVNYQKIFDYVNSHPELNAEMSFGTLQDYFKSVRQDSLASTKSELGAFKTLSGDFFTYADREDNYWSGYYTSRPFYKNMDRVLEGYLRAAEILFSMARAEMAYLGTDVREMGDLLMKELLVARQNLALFQHHDGVTGTAKDHVVVDYGARMLASIVKCQSVMSEAAHYLLTRSKPKYAFRDVLWFDLDDARESHDSLPVRTVIDVQAQRYPAALVVFNSHAKLRSEVVSVRVTDGSVKVYAVNTVEGSEEREYVEAQLGPVFEASGQISSSEFELSFVASVKALSLRSYYVELLSPDDVGQFQVDTAKITMMNVEGQPFRVMPFEAPVALESGEAFSLENAYVKVEFGSDGMISAVTTLDDKVRTVVKLEMIKYGTRASGEMSGAYLFLPNGEAEVLKMKSPPLVRVVEGAIVSRVEVFTPWMRHVVTLKASPGSDGTGIQIDNDVDIRNMRNAEVGMRLSTDLKSGEDFFTDLNGFQMIRRKRRLDKLPLQANYYPVPSMAYIQDASSRMTLVTKQPLGGSSLKEGQLEILMDRRLMQDDNRGVGQGVTDNHVTPHSFYLLLERKLDGCSKDELPTGLSSYPSLLALNVRHGLINPFYRMIRNPDTENGEKPLIHAFEPVTQDLDCDIELLNLRTMVKSFESAEPSDEAALIIHRQGFNACYRPVGMTCKTNLGKVNLEGLFPELFSQDVKHATLSLMHEGVNIQKGFVVSINPMEVYSFLLRR